MPELSHRRVWTKLKAIKGIRVLLLQALVLYALILDADMPKWVKAAAMAALLYLIDPIDAVPDFTPTIGYLDDLAVLAAVIKALHDQVQPRHELQANQMYAEL